MTEPHSNDSIRASGSGLEPDDLDGYTIEELSDYLDAGRTPPDPGIEQSPGCVIALNALERLRALTPQLLEADTAAEAAPDEGWVQGILSSITLDARAGRRIPIPADSSTADLGITEGAVRALIRGAENAVPGVLIGRCRLHGDVTVAGQPITVQVDISVSYGMQVQETVERLRQEIASRLLAHGPLEVSGVDVNVFDVYQLPYQTGDQG